MLKALAYYTINTCYSKEEQLQVCIDGSRMYAFIKVEADVHCELFSLNGLIGPYATTSDGEIVVIYKDPYLQLI